MAGRRGPALDLQGVGRADAAGIARLKLEREEKNIFSPDPPPAWTGLILGNIPEVPYRKEDPRFWEVAQPDWDDNTARETVTDSRAQGITVSHTHLLALLSQPAAPSASVTWARDTARRLQDENKIPKGARKAELARLLEAESKNAVKAGQLSRALKASYIENQLVPWGIWPLSSFK
jgi:hypothetical protein